MASYGTDTFTNVPIDYPVHSGDISRVYSNILWQHVSNVSKTICQQVLSVSNILWQHIQSVSNALCVRYTFLATTVPPPLRNTVGTTLEFKQLFRKGFVNTSSQHLTKEVNSGLLLLFLLRYKQFT